MCNLINAFRKDKVLNRKIVSLCSLLHMTNFSKYPAAKSEPIFTMCQILQEWKMLLRNFLLKKNSNKLKELCISIQGLNIIRYNDEMTACKIVVIFSQQSCLLV